ncbi:hypothetical protein HYALB_00008302 [Hymenoscyphus albidus]|uniref:Uncharacterized protein n=1 Tax=Hymenoscyphus albidus TaxID=595503 RepID=A0A9N9Q243_9HELO|nr:hypothetical protein HYALB_00008302 [Hymenoscyphus albidus]
MPSTDMADDPFDWSIDRVVQELCGNKPSWETSIHASRLDPTELEKNLREQEIDGCVLLVNVNDKVLTKDFNIKVVGRRAFVHNAIKELRKRSPKYQAFVGKETAPSIASYHPSSGIHSPNGMAHQSNGQINTWPNLALLSQPPSYITPSETPDDNKRRKLGDESNAGDAEAQFEEPAPELEREPAATADPKTSVAPGVVAIVEINGKKRKRLEPILLTTQTSNSNDTVECADDVAHTPHASPPLDSQHVAEAANDIALTPAPVIEDVPVQDTPAPGQMFVDSTGRKRPIPINESRPEMSITNKDIQVDPAPQSEQLLPSTYVPLKGRTTDNLAKSFAGYLGKQKMPVDDLFYASTPVGKELPSGDDIGEEFFMVQGALPTGLRLYVNNAMKNFLRSKPRFFTRDGKEFAAVMPYSTNFKSEFENQHFTLFQPDLEGKYTASREELSSSWPEVNPKMSLTTENILGEERSVRFNLPGPDMLSGIGNQPKFDPSMLEKYNYLEGGDEVLPLYGESDSDNEVDEQTWREMENERGEKLERPLRQSRKPALSTDEVNSAINEGISALQLVWKRDQLPKLEVKGYRMWQKSKNQKSKKRDVAAAQFKLDFSLRHIDNMRQEITKNTYTSIKQVLKQTGIMEVDVYNCEVMRWTIQLLESKISPDKPKQLVSLRVSKTPEKLPIKLDDTEGEDLDTESEGRSSDDDMGSFIEEDSATEQDVEHQLDLADSEATDDESVASDKNLAQVLPVSSVSPATKINWKVARRSPEGSGRLAVSPSASYGSESAQNPRTRPSTPSKDEPSALIRTPSAKPSNFIDLSILTSSDDGGRSKYIDLITPQKAKKLNSPIKISDDDTEPSTPHNELAAYVDINTIPEALKDAYAKLTSEGDVGRLLGLVLQRMREDRKERTRNFLSETKVDQIQTAMAHEMEASSGHCSDIKLVMWLFKIYIDCKYIPFSPTLTNAFVASIRDHEDIQLAPFCTICHELLDPSSKAIQLVSVKESTESSKKRKKGPRRKKDRSGRSEAASDVDEEDGEPLSAIRRRRPETLATTSEDEKTADESPSKKKKKLVEDKDALEMRQQDRQRLAEQAERRAQLQAKLAMSGHARDEASGRIIINDAKSDEQGFIYVHPSIAPLIKKHQVEGVRFMFNQVVGDEKTTQGCLLAHTMGLGKTMQVITLLVAIAEAAMSDDPTVVSQIPPRLRKSRTLVLCPPTLIDNWMDEFLLWAPEGLLGGLVKISSNTIPHERALEIRNWHSNGGVLIMGYEMFRAHVYSMEKTQVGSSLEHTQLCEYLLEFPEIIIADEAHKLKNEKSKLNMAAVRFRSNSRIALTGSPLANNIEEYHAMIEFISPNYLGPVKEFRQKYVTPIQDGLWKDSTPHERRKSLKMLGVLKEDIAPKVHRKEMGVLRDSLPAKKEFVITFSLTELQRKAYSIYVEAMKSGSGHARTKDGEIRASTVFGWVSVLQLLCNHPACFKTKLNERKEDAKKELVSTKGLSDSSEGADVEDAEDSSIWKIGVSQQLVDDEMSLFQSDETDLNAIELSNKTLVLCEILDASKAVNDKVLVFSQSIITLNFLEQLCKDQGRVYNRLDGKTKMANRQAEAKSFNTDETELYLISTTAGGLGLNLPGANRVVIFDFKYNPVQEEQAVGRAYRIGQVKKTFVYRFIAGGTFEGAVHNKAIFKTQLASRVIDRKNPMAYATKLYSSDLLFEPKEVPQEDLSEFRGMDTKVLDRVLSSVKTAGIVRSIVQTDTFERDDEDKLTAEEMMEVKEMLGDEQLKRFNPAAYAAKQQARQAHALQLSAQQSTARYNQPQFSTSISKATALPVSQARPRQALPNKQIVRPVTQTHQVSHVAVPRAPPYNHQTSSMHTSRPTAQNPQVPQAQAQQLQHKSSANQPQAAPVAGTGGYGESAPQPDDFSNLVVAESAPAVPRSSPKAERPTLGPKYSAKKESRIVPPQKEQHDSRYKSPTPMPMDIEGDTTNVTQRAESPSSDELALATSKKKPISNQPPNKSHGLPPIMGRNTHVRSKDPEMMTLPRTSSTQTMSSSSMSRRDGRSPKSSQDIQNVCIEPHFPKFPVIPFEKSPQTSSDAHTVSRGQLSTSVRSQSAEPKSSPRIISHTRSPSDIDGSKALLALSGTLFQGHNNRLGDAALQNYETRPPVSTRDSIPHQENTSYETPQSTPSQSTPLQPASPDPPSSSGSASRKSPIRDGLKLLLSKFYHP